MASIVNRPNGHRWIQFSDRDGRRQTIRLGKCGAKDANLIATRIESLVARSLTGESLDPLVAGWLVSLGDTLHARLAAVGLVERRSNTQKAEITVDDFTKNYIDRRADAAPRTVSNWNQTRRHILAVMAGVRMVDVTPALARDFKTKMQTAGLAATIIGKWVKNARQFFADAVDRKVIPINPFAKLKGSGQANRERIAYVEAGIVEQVISESSKQLALMVALARYAGLRTPSESLALKWEDINWGKSRMMVRSRKTAHSGKSARIVPISDRLHPLLLEAFDAAEPGSEYVVHHWRNAEKNLRTSLLKAINRAGLKPWPRLFHNLRASCIIDWAESLPAHVVSEFAGNTTAINAGHYLAPKESHYAKAIGSMENNPKQNPKHYPKQSGAVPACTESKLPSAAIQKHSVIANKNAPADAGASVCQIGQLPPRGVEPLLIG